MIIKMSPATPGPPLAALDVLVGRGHLHPAVALRPQHLEALIRHGVV